MADRNLVVGQTLTGTLTFSLAAPTDGAVASDNPFVTASLAADGVTYTCVCVGAASDGSMTVVDITYTGTSVAPDQGPAQVTPMTLSVSLAPVAETGNFNPSGATITGP